MTELKCPGPPHVCARDGICPVHGANRPGQSETPDPVNRPAHYTAHPSNVECITIAEHFSFNIGNAIKYLWRADTKGNPIEDLQKARWYADREISRRERGAK